jgi:general secretion pathway protein I
MVALAILAIALTSIYRLHSQTLLMSSRARFYSQAPFLAQQKLSEIERLGIKMLAEGSGDFGEDQPSFNWAVKVEDIRSELLSKDSKYRMVRIDLTITQHDDDTYNLRTYRIYAE